MSRGGGHGQRERSRLLTEWELNSGFDSRPLDCHLSWNQELDAQPTELPSPTRMAFLFHFICRILVYHYVFAIAGENSNKFLFARFCQL